MPVSTALTISFVLCASAFAQTPDPPLAQDVPRPPTVYRIPYSLFNPTPKGERRALDPERPDATQNPTTVDAGVIQIETGFFQYTKDSHRLTPDSVETWAILSETTLRLGLLTDLELQIIFTPYISQETTPDGGPKFTDDGISDFTLRLRHNYWGNDPEPDQDTALGAEAFVILPTGSQVSSGKVEAGAAGNFQWDFSQDFSLAFTAQPAFRYDTSNARYDFVLLTTAELIVEVLDRITGYAELAGTATTAGSSAYDASLNLGGLLYLTNDVALDAGLNIGLTRAADDFSVTIGITVRF